MYPVFFETCQCVLLHVALTRLYRIPRPHSPFPVPVPCPISRFQKSVRDWSGILWERHPLGAGILERERDLGAGTGFGSGIWERGRDLGAGFGSGIWERGRDLVREFLEREEASKDIAESPTAQPERPSLSLSVKSNLHSSMFF